MLHQKLWKFENGEEIGLSSISESELEEKLVLNPDILNNEWLLIGEQIITDGGRLDLLFLEPDGDLVVVELKKNKTPREVTAQVMDYASTISNYTVDDVKTAYTQLSNKHNNLPATLYEAYQKKYGRELDDDTINKRNVKMVVVASQIDESTERILNYLRDKCNVDINILFFNVYECNGEKIIGRTWFGKDIEIIDRKEQELKLWNKYAYVVFGSGERKWKDALQYGFISAGGGLWYSQTLNKLDVGDKILVHIPKKGYVGYGIVTDTVKPAKDIVFDYDSKKLGFADIEDGKDYLYHLDDIDNAEYVVKVDWKYTISDEDKAVWEQGFFSNQNSACKPTAAKWDYTVDRLKKLWNICD